MKKTRIMLVDDEVVQLEAMRRALKMRADRWEIVCLDAAQAALQQLLEEDYDVVVTDVKMPGMSGLELLERVRHDERTKHVPVVVVTGLGEQGLKKRALELGAADLVAKPVDIEQLAARLEGVLQLKAQQDGLLEANACLRAELNRIKIETLRTRLSLICRLGKVAEERDVGTGCHTLRVAHYSRITAAAMGFDLAFQEMLLLTAPLHDIGKIAIPDKILLKQGPLTPGERAVMETHCEIGVRILKDPSLIESTLGGDWPVTSVIGEFSDPLLDIAAAIALCHHEKWDGSGYPHRLAGIAIPCEARIVAIADMFDALTSDWPYKPACSEETALQSIRQDEGSRFDPAVCKAFVDGFSEIREACGRIRDGSMPSDLAGGPK